jgi:hypothetical protein
MRFVAIQSLKLTGTVTLPARNYGARAVNRSGFLLKSIVHV